jgi:tyrosine-protein kinase Etk/Wzc
LENRIASAGQVLQQIPRRATEEQRLRRQVDLAETRYQDLEQQYQSALYAQAAEELGARVLDAAVVPSRPIRDTALRLIAMAFAASLGAAVVLALLLDRIDSRVRYPDQVSTDLGLTILGAIPRIKVGVGKQLSGSRSQTVQVVEALRGIRLGLLHAHGVAGPLITTISSPGPSEGKSFVTSNLALAFADAGHRTLLIDGDVRRGELHRLLGTQRKPGMTDFLQGAAQREDIVQSTQYESLWFIGGGTRVHSAPELLSSPALAQLLLALRSSYDVILVDSPPLGAGVDPFVLATATGNLLMVLRTGVTDREMAEAKLDMVDRLPIRVLGAILNDVHTGGVYRYYGYHYYLDGYETQDEGEGGPDESRSVPAARVS